MSMHVRVFYDRRGLTIENLYFFAAGTRRLAVVLPSIMGTDTRLVPYHHVSSDTCLYSGLFFYWYVPSRGFLFLPPGVIDI